MTKPVSEVVEELERLLNSTPSYSRWAARVSELLPTLLAEIKRGREALEEAASTLDRVSQGIEDAPPELRQFPYGLMAYTAKWLRARAALEGKEN